MGFFIGCWGFFADDGGGVMVRESFYEKSLVCPCKMLRHAELDHHLTAEME